MWSNNNDNNNIGSREKKYRMSLEKILLRAADDICMYFWLLDSFKQSEISVEKIWDLVKTIRVGHIHINCVMFHYDLSPWFADFSRCNRCYWYYASNIDVLIPI